MKKLIKKFLQTFIKIEVIKFRENGQPKEFTTMYFFSRKITSAVFAGKEEKEDVKKINDDLISLFIL